MVTDWAFSLIPFVIVANLQLSRRKKVSVICILGLGVFASVATCVRMPYLQYYDVEKYPTETLCKSKNRGPGAYTNESPRPLDHLGAIVITSNLECSLGLLACALPPLRKLFKFYYGSTHEATVPVSHPYSAEKLNSTSQMGGTPNVTLWCSPPLVLNVR
jgi:hypothetical protein